MEYEERTACPVCGEGMLFARDGGTAKPPFPTDWWLFVVHDHELDPPIWRASCFHRSKGGRYPKEAKVIMELQKANRRAVVTARQVNNASKGSVDHVVR